MMYRIRLKSRAGLVGLMLIAAMATGCNVNSRKTPAPNTADSGHVYFTLGVEQQQPDGKWQKIPIKNHTAALERKPFRLVFYFEQLSPILAQASFDSRIMRQAAAGKDIETFLLPSAGFAEEALNPRRNICVRREGAYHSWGYYGPQLHRFDADGVVNVTEGGYLCRRTIEKLDIDGREVNIKDVKPEAVYMVFIQTAQNPASQKRTEKQRDWLTLKFK